MSNTDSENDRHGGEVNQLFGDVDADDSKALRSWMINVNNYLHRNGLIDSEQRSELHDKTMKATGWDDGE